MADEDKKIEDKAKDDAAKKDGAKKDDFPADLDKGKADAKRKDEDDKDKDRDDKKRDDAEAGHSLMKTIADGVKALADSVAGLGKRMDAVEQRDDKKRDDAKRKDEDDPDKKKDEPKEVVADKAKKDAKRDDARKDEEKEEEKAKADSVDFRAELDRVRALIPKDMDDADYHKLADAQARADEVFADFGRHAPRPLQGESVGGYERRCVRILKEHSPTWKATEVTTAFADDAAFNIVRDQVYREARTTARNPVNIPAGELRMQEKRRDGHIIREFYGEPRTWMDPLAGATQLKGTGAWLTPGTNRVN